MAQKRKSLQTQFSSEEKYFPRSKKERRLTQAFSLLSQQKDISNFLRDLLTLPEIEEFANRLEIARLLSLGKSYDEVARLLEVSTTTVTRVSHWLYRGCGGYNKIIKRLKT